MAAILLDAGPADADLTRSRYVLLVPATCRAVESPAPWDLCVFRK